jgi:predicted enzyme related to lactoylglutathione lyase
MITGVHTLVYAHDHEAAKAFFRDVLRLPFADTGGGWLIFKTGPSEMASHPSSWGEEDQAGGTDQAFDLSLMCDDLAATVAELRSRGATVADEVVEQPWGHTVQLDVPGAGALTLFEPTYEPPATSL